MPSTYESQAARDAERVSYGDRAYWDYLERSAKEHRDFFRRHGNEELAARMMSRDLTEALRGNEGQ